MQLINAVTLLLTFGLVFPPLAVVICASVWSETCFTQLLMRRLLGEAEAASAATGRLYRRRLEKDAQGMRRRECVRGSELYLLCLHHLFLPTFPLRSTAFDKSLLLTLLTVSAVFCAYFAFDTLGDSHGWRAGLGAAAALLGAALALMLGYYCHSRYLDGGDLFLATMLRWGVGCVGCVRGCLRLFLCLRLCCGACSRYDLLLYLYAKNSKSY